MRWKGTIRAVGTTLRAAERDAKRRQRELEKEQKKYEMMQELDQAAYEVDVFENHIDVIQSLHKDCSNPIDWKNIAQSNQPEEPPHARDRENNAKNKLDQYKPGVIDRVFKRQEKKKKLLEKSIEDAIKTDLDNYQKSISTWEKEVKKWEESVRIAKSLLEGDKRAKLKVIENYQPFAEIANLGSNLSVTIFDNGLLETTIKVHGTEIIPTESKSLLKSGRLSVKNMPKGKFNEIYQDYVCSCVLRIANELFSILPDKLVLITAVDELLNSKTGHLEEAPILSVAISRNTIKSLNLEAIDPSDSMSNFLHNMSFKKTKGFERVSRIDVNQIDL